MPTTLRIAIPEPTSTDHAYNTRSLPQYIAALHSVGATATVIPLTERPDRVAKLLSTTHGVLFPGSGFDVDPERYGDSRISACEPADPARTAVDELLLQDAFNLHKPILAICYGIQSMNVWRGGSLIQDLAHEGKTRVNHQPGRTVEEAHAVQITPNSRLDRIAGAQTFQVNSSHHQAVRVPGNSLKVTAVSPEDGVIEAAELDSSDHFVVGVQWHPERTVTTSAVSRALFAALAHEAESWRTAHAAPATASV